MRVYAVGDIHGRADLLEPMLGWIRSDSRSRAREPDVHVVFLGDLIDRGPASRGVLDLLVDEHESFGRRHFILGNHEQALLNAIDGDMAALDEWLGFGGAATLESYGVDPALQWRNPDALHAKMVAAIPARHVAFLRAMRPSVRLGGYLFVHAGIRPGIPLDEQDGRDLRWIRNEFLSSRADHGVMVVHGHTVSDSVQFRHNRIGIDTGAYASGRLSVLGLERERRWLLVSRSEPT